MSSNATFYDNPIGTKREIPIAPLADTKTSVELVKDNEPDAFYFRMLEKQGITLDKNQIEAVRIVDGPALISAGAGSGKTRVLISRAGYLLVVKKISPQNLLIVTFSKKAATEIKDRISQIPDINQSMSQNIHTGTFHSIFLRILWKSGYKQKILSNEKHKQVIIKRLIKELNLDLQDSYQPETLLALLSSYKINMQSIEELPEKTTIEKELKTIFSMYENWKEQNSYFDFDDILLEAYKLLQSNTKLLNALKARFQYIMVDEFQDTNPISYELIRMLSKDNLYIVGDKNQCIYSFNGSDISAILNFPEAHQNTKVIHLDTNYRSTTNIVGLGNAILQKNEYGYAAHLTATKESEFTPQFIRPSSSDEEADMIVKHIIKKRAKQQRKYKDHAILYRTASSSRAIFEQLVVNDIPFITYSESDTFYESSTIKPVISYLRLSLERDNLNYIEDILPSLYLPKEKTMEHMEWEQLASPNPFPLFHALSMPDLKEFQKKQLYGQIQLIKELRSKKPLDAIVEIRKSYDKHMDANDRRNLTFNKEILKEMLDELETSAKRFDSIEEFLSFIDLIIERNNQMKELRKNPNADAVALMTIHKSKGLEFPYVYLIGASDTILPHHSALQADKLTDVITKEKGLHKVNALLEEERRLTYVAITRAEKEVYISSPAVYRGKKVGLTRFLAEVYPTLKSKSTKKNEKEYLVPSEGQENVYAWICTSDSCNIWQKITNYEDSIQEEKSCPVCQSRMEKGVKMTSAIS